MQGDNQRSLTTMLLVAGAFLAVYYASTYFFGDGAEQPEGGETGQEQVAPEQDAQRAAEARRDSAERQARRETATITTDEMVVEIDNLGGGVQHARLLGERFREAEEHLDLVTTTREEYEPLRIDLPGIGIPADAVWEIEQESPTSVRLRWQGNGVEVVRRIEAGSGPYQIWQTVRVRNLGSAERDTRFRVSTWHYVLREHEGGGFFGSRSPEISQGLCRHEGETERKDRASLAERHGYRNDIEFVALENVYFVQALAPSGEPAEMCGLQTSDRGDVDGEPEGGLFEATLLYPVVELPAGGEHVWRHLAYLGPKIPSALERAGHGLTEVVNLGTFAIIARAFTSLLRFIYGYVGNWGIAIILLTILVRIALFPIMERQFRSMAGMRKLKPEMDEINARFADDPEKKQAAIMDMYRRHGINPLAQLSGCLPVLLQMPVFFALYTSLSTNVELYHQPFALWWQDLSAPDPYFVLPLLIGALMFLQQKLTPTSMDPAQAKVMQFMPVIVTVFMLFLPAGLCVYMLTNSSLSMTQQKLNQWRMDRKEATAASATPAATVVDATPPVGDDSKAGRGGGGGSKPTSPRGSGRSRRG